MPSSSVLILAVALIVAVRALPVDEILARNGFSSTISDGGQASGGFGASSCTGPFDKCALTGLLGTSLLKVGSENANGDSAFPGAADGKTFHGIIGGSNTTRKVPQGSGFSGDGGEAPGGSVVDGYPALIELDPDNAGQGGNASSRNSSGLVI